MADSSKQSSAWNRALAMAERTPPTRNRYVDFLRAASITVVVLGHWVMAAPHWANGRAELGHILDLSPWSHWLTWALQVMPVFFIVGGFSNAITWQKTEEGGKTYASWLDSRFRRLVAPVLPLLIAWSIFGLAAQLLDVAPNTLRVGSQVALVPTWFLSVYLMVILAVPWTYRLWRLLGMGSFVLLALAAVAIDAGAFGAGVTWLRWLNYALVWAAVHQLGFAWREDRLAGWRAPALGAFGLATLFCLVRLGPYPISMVGVPGQAISNSLPPTIALLALGMFQGGLLLSAEGPMRRWLDGRRAWAATVLVNANIMTLFLWHSTVLVLVIGALVALGGPGLEIEPATGTWWWARIPWVAALAVLLLPFMAIFGRFERPKSTGNSVSRNPNTVRLLAGSVLFCLGIALLALEGVGGGELGIRVGVLALPFAGALLGGVGRKS
jgi:hypothetical protein